MRILLCLTAVLLAVPVGSAGAATARKWPGDPAVAVADPAGVLGDNVSGLSFDGPDVLWSVKNGPGTLYRLARSGGGRRPADGWSSGKRLRYRDGSLPKVLRYDTGSTASELGAAAEWDLTGDLPAVGDNGGFEGITWIPDGS